MLFRERCDDWTTSDEIDDTGIDTSAYNATLVTNVITAASDWLYQKTFGRFPGECQQTIRPCGHVSSCSVVTLPMLDGYQPPCTCGRGDVVALPYGPIVSIDLVAVDGVALVEGTDYRFVQPNRLARIDANWPACNNPSKTATATDGGAWFVTYTAGESPPQLGRFAASHLAAELLKANAGDCALPPGTIRVQGLGITMDLSSEQATAALFPVAAFFDAYRARPAPTVRVAGHHRVFTEPAITSL